MKLEEELAVSSTVSSFMGAFAGCVEVFMQQPVVTWKNAVQDGRPVPLDPRLLYRGVLVNAGSMAPINGIQFGVNRYLEEKFEVGGYLSDQARIATATTAGAVSGIISCPGELVMIQQQKKSLGLMDQIRQLAAQHGTAGFFRGLAPTVVREAIFTGAYLGVIPSIRDKLMSSFPGAFENRPVAALASASVAAGITATFVTHPFDTVKTRMQANLQALEYRTMTGATGAMWREGGSRLFFHGLLPRTLRVTLAVFILAEAKDQLTNMYLHMEKYRRKNFALAQERDN